MNETDQLAELQLMCPGAAFKTEAGQTFVHLPDLNIPVGAGNVTRDALLTLSGHSGYASRLFLSAPVPERGANWTSHTVLGRTWHTPSWRDVHPTHPIEMLLQHLKAYR